MILIKYLLINSSTGSTINKEIHIVKTQLLENADGNSELMSFNFVKYITCSFTPLYFSTDFWVLRCILSILLLTQNKKGKLFSKYVQYYLIFHFRCNTTFEQQMLGLLYVLFLVTMVVVLSFKAKGVRENYREAMYIGLTMGFTVCIFLVWILGGFIAPPEYQVLNGKKSFELWCMYLKGW